jgi:hypothetical protein
MNGTRNTCRAALAIFATASIFTVAWAQTSGLTNKSTDLRASPDDSAKLIRTLPSKTTVDLLEKLGVWNRVKTGSDQGFIRMMDMGGGATVAASQSTTSGSALAALNRLAGSDRSGDTRAQSATVGVRGLTKADVLKANANPEALARMKSYQVSDSDAQNFASAGRLTFRSVAYLAKDAVAANSGARK